MTSQVDHRFDCENIASLNFRSLTRLSIVRNLRILVHAPANSVTDIIANDGVSMSLAIPLYAPSNIAEPFSRPTLLDGSLETLFSYSDQLKPLIRHHAYRHCCRSIPRS